LNIAKERSKNFKIYDLNRELIYVKSKRTKFRRHHRGNRKGKLVEETLLFWRFWFTGLRTRVDQVVRLNLVDVLTRYVRRNGKLWIRILTNQ
jgi:ribosomal protein L16/L10AE